MPIRFLKTNPEEPSTPQTLGPSLKAIPSMRGSVESYRSTSVWHLISERSYGEAVDKLKEIVEKDLEITQPDVKTLVPCIVELKEAATKREEEEIRRAHKVMMRSFASLVDKLVKYRPESRPYAFDALQYELRRSGPLWRRFECESFREKPEKNEKPRKQGNNGEKLKLTARSRNN